MLRVVLATLLAVALVGIGLQALDSVRQTNGHAAVRAALDRIEDAARTLAVRNDATPGAMGARRVLRLSLPRRSWATAGLATLTLRAGADWNGTRARWRLAGDRFRSRHLTGPRLRPAGGCMTLGSGRVRVRLALRRRAGRRLVRLTRLGR